MDWNMFFEFGALILSFFGAVFLAVPMLRIPRDSDDKLIVDHRYDRMTVGFRKDRIMGFGGLFLLGLSVVFQILSLSSIVPIESDVVLESEVVETEQKTSQGMYLIYREECTQEADELWDMLDRFIKDPTITSEEAQNLARQAGITDENNLVIDKDILVKECIAEKELVYK